MTRRPQLDATAIAVVAALAFAAVLRLVALAGPPLDPAEASQSVAAWWTATASGEEAARLTPRPSSALLLGLDTLTFWLAGGAGDGLARLAPALAGAALVLLALLRRPESWASVLPLAVVLATDPWLVAASRRASGAIFSAGAAIACYLLLRRLTRSAPAGSVADAARRQWAAWAVAAGLLLGSGATAWDFLPPVLAGAVLATARRGAVPPSVPQPSAGALIGLAGAAALVAATTGLVQWQGPALWSNSVESWLSSWNGGLGGATMPAMPQWGVALGAYELAVGALAVWGLSRRWRRRGAASAGEPGASRVEADTLAVWILWGAAMQLRSSPEAFLALQTPLLLGAVLGVEELLALLSRPAPGRDAAVAPHRVGAALALVAGVMATIGIAPAAQTLPAARQLARDVAVLLERPAKERPALEIETGATIDGVLAWYLRDAPVRWVASASSESAARPRLVLGSELRPLDSLSTDPESPVYTIAVTGDSIRVVKPR